MVPVARSSHGGVSQPGIDWKKTCSPIASESIDDALVLREQSHMFSKRLRLCHLACGRKKGLD